MIPLFNESWQWSSGQLSNPNPQQRAARAADAAKGPPSSPTRYLPSDNAAGEKNYTAGGICDSSVRTVWPWRRFTCPIQTRGNHERIGYRHGSLAGSRIMDSYVGSRDLATGWVRNEGYMNNVLQNFQWITIPKIICYNELKLAFSWPLLNPIFLVVIAYFLYILSEWRIVNVSQC